MVHSINAAEPRLSQIHCFHLRHDSLYRFESKTQKNIIHIADIWWLGYWIRHSKTSQLMDRSLHFCCH
ncbi:hypothetical protein ACE6H2_027770 [Prunus campanulata]